MDTVCYFDISGEPVTASHYCYKQMDTDGFPPHTHDCCELIYLKNGSVSYLAEGRHYIVEAGSCILTRPGIRHTIRFRDNAVYDRYVFLLDRSLFDPLPESLEVLNLKSNAIVQELFHKMDFYADYLEQNSLETVIRNLIEEALLNFKIISARQPAGYTANPIITEAVSYITTHLQEPITLEALCAHLHITKSYLHRLFLEYLQLPPAKYITAKRLNKARMDIRAGCKPAQTYGLWGFQDYCTFYRNYVRHFGYPPSEECSRPSAQVIEW